MSSDLHGTMIRLTCTVLFSALFSGVLFAETAPYYRFWRGFKKADLAWKDFHQALVTDFMPATVKTHGHEGLVSYLVVLPSATDSVVVPDEAALVAYQSEETYKTVSSTPHGQAYQKKHGDIFTSKVSPSADLLAKQRASRSLVPVAFSTILADDFRREGAYDVLGQPIDWQTGHSVFFLGLRKPSLRPDFFWDALHKHISYVKTAFPPFGLRGYVVLVDRDYEMAFMNWNTKEAMEKTFQSPQGKALMKDAQGLLNTLMWQDFRDFDGLVQPGECVNVKFPRP